MTGKMLGHYKILSQLGKGGMGEVYVAEDTKLRRKVAVKILPPEMAFNPSRVERFKREAEAIAALNHPNIVTIYSVEEAENTHFLTMELVEGKNLSELIPTGGMDSESFLKTATQIAEAISAAHEKGIIHRDLKPTNILISGEGRVKVLDFSLAKISDTAWVSDVTQFPTRELTQEGMIVGTIPYMSPEQLQGRSIDHRTDIFSLGIIFYEMIIGARPFQGESPLEIMSSLLRDKPDSVDRQKKNVSPELGRLIQKCLEKDPNQRLQSVNELVNEFKKAQQRLSVASFSGSLGRMESSGQQAPVIAEKSVAVLPFTNMSADPENEFFSEGVAEEIINALLHVEGLRVAARTSSFSFKGKSVEIDEIGKKLHVANVLEGSVRKMGSRVRVTVQLIDVSSGFHIWSERYDRELIDIFDVQDEIARTISNRLKITLDSGERLVKSATDNMEAYQLALKGRTLLTRRGTGIPQGMQCLQKAVDLDPNYARAWAGLADSYTLIGYWGFAPAGDTMPKALTAAHRSIDLDPGLSEGYNALACPTMLYEWNYPEAEREFLLALELNPNYTQARC
jgi:serine/threonine protein kinase